MNRRYLIAALAGVVGLIVFVAVWFEPQALLFDKTANEAAPAGAVPVAASEATVVVAAPTDPVAAPSTDSASVPPQSAAAPATSTTQPVGSAPAEASTPPAAAVPNEPPLAPVVESAAVEPTTTVPAQTPTTTIAVTTTTPPPPAPTQLISLDHGTSGNVSILLGVDGIRYLRFEGLDTDNGPDLKVYLSTNSHTGPEDAFDDQIVNLGQLTANKGDQNYAIPGDVDLSSFASVVIWCDRFDSAFGAAPLPR